jgi:hypothetical protein
LFKWVRTVEPVVVRDETDSNQQSINPKDRDDQKKGRAANKDVETQLTVVKRKASLTLSSVLPPDRLDKTSKVPISPVMKDDMANSRHPPVRKTNSSILKGISIAAAIMLNKITIMKKTARNAITTLFTS